MTGPAVDGATALVVVVLPDTGPAAETFAAMAEVVGAAGRTVLLADAAADADEAQRAAAVAELVREQGTPAVLVGHARGAAAAAAAAAEVSDLVAGLVLITPDPAGSRYPDVRCPAMILVGPADRSESVAVHERMGGPSDVHVVEAAGHRPHVDCPDYTGAVVLRGLAAIEWGRTATELPEVGVVAERSEATRAGRPDLSGMTDQELAQRVQTLVPVLNAACQCQDRVGLASWAGLATLRRLTESVGEPGLYLELISGLGDVVSAQPAFALWDLAATISASTTLSALLAAGPRAFLDEVLAADGGTEAGRFGLELRGFLARHGHLGAGDWEIGVPSWEMDPEQVIVLLAELCPTDAARAPAGQHDECRRRRVEAEARMRSHLAEGGAARSEFEIAVRAAALFVPAAERARSAAIVAFGEMRLAMHEFGRRAAADGRITQALDLFVLRADELIGYIQDPASFDDVIASRCKERSASGPTAAHLVGAGPPVRSATLPDVDTSAPAVPAATVGDVLTGRGGSRGHYIGPVRVVRDLSSPSNIATGDVLVLPASDPAWTPLFTVAGAVVAEIGGLTCHAMVISRELGLPAVVAVREATVLLQDGMQVAVDGNAGTVTVLDGGLRPAAPRRAAPAPSPPSGT